MKSSGDWYEDAGALCRLAQSKMGGVPTTEGVLSQGPRGASENSVPYLVLGVLKILCHSHEHGESVFEQARTASARTANSLPTTASYMQYKNGKHLLSAGVGGKIVAKLMRHM